MKEQHDEWNELLDSVDGRQVEERRFPIIEWDGFHFDTAYTYWSQTNTVAGTVWRIVMGEGRTLVVRPFQTLETPAPEAHLALKGIYPILSGCGSDFIFTVGCVSMVNIELEGGYSRPPVDIWEWTNAEELADLRRWEHPEWKPALEEYIAWHEKQEFSATAQVKAATKQMNAERRKRWVANKLAEWTGAPEKSPVRLIDEEQPTPEKLKKWEEKAKAMGKADGLVGEKLEKIIEKAVHEKAFPILHARKKISNEVLHAPLKKLKESDLWKECDRESGIIEGKREERYGVKALVKIPPLPTGEQFYPTDIAAKYLKALASARGVGAGKLQHLYDFIRDDVCNGNRVSPTIGEHALRRVVDKVKELTGTDIAERLAESIPYVKSQMVTDAARHEILERARWVAVFADGKQYLVEAIDMDIHAGQDALYYKSLGLSEDVERQQEAAAGKKRKEVRNQFNAMPITLPEGWKPSMTRTDLMKVVGWSVATIETFEEQGRLRAVSDTSPVSGARADKKKKRGKKRRYSGEQAYLLHSEECKKAMFV